MSANPTTIKRLFGFSYNECAHPECDQQMIEVDKNTGSAVVYAEIAHIHGQKSGAERFKKSVCDDKEKLHGFDNLLLLCAKHHKMIDEKGAGEVYTAEVVRNWKTDHMLKYAADKDREWVFGGKTINFWLNGEQVSISYWITKGGELRFHTEEQLVQMSAAFDLAMFISSIGSLLGTLDHISGEPADPSHQTVNDGYVRRLKDDAERLKKSFLGRPPKLHESAMHRIYDNLNKCPDITLAELAEVGTEKRAMTTTLIQGEVTPERIVEALLHAKEQAVKKRDV